MCGIAGWVSYQRHLSDYRDILLKMTRTMSLRGPDAEGLWIDDHVGLGHRRLAIIDLTGGVQPMLARDGDEVIAALTYSGEVYNFQELRDELSAYGHVFKTRSDTEVVLVAYLQWGEQMVDHLNGMYAFAIWDVKKEELLLVRDRMGVKPLYFYETDDGVLFGSEIKAILAHPEVPHRVTADGLREMFELVKAPGHGIFSGVHEVIPGQVVRVNRRGLRQRTYWALEARPHEDDQQTTIEKTRALLEDIVERQIISDVPLCSLLSGGLDSSIITAMASQALERRESAKVRSFSVDFVDHGAAFVADGFRVAPDAPFVRDLVNHAGTSHEEIILDSRSLAAKDLRNAVLNAFDYPSFIFGDICTSLYGLFESVRQSSTVALSGESADELFGGYPWFHNADAIAAPTFPWLSSGFDGMFDVKSLFEPELLKELNLPDYVRDQYRKAIAECPVLDGESPAERRMREINYLNLTRFVRVLLDRKDRMSMAVGLEVRVPFCDHRLIEYIFNTPWSMKSFDGREKSVLRAAGRHLLPTSIIERRKSPYPSTQDPAYELALRRDVAEIAADNTTPAHAILNKTNVKNLLNRPLKDISTPQERRGLDFVLGVNDWLQSYKVDLAV